MEKEYGIPASWIAFPLHPEIPEQGLSLHDLFRGRGINIEQMMSYLKGVAEREGLPFGERTMTYNSRLAQELGKWAESKGKGKAFHMEVFQAYFAHGSNIARPSVLLDLATAVGLPRDEAHQVLQKRTFKNAVDKDWARSQEIAVTAVPTFLIHDKRMVGAHPYEALAQFMEDHGARKAS